MYMSLYMSEMESSIGNSHRTWDFSGLWELWVNKLLLLMKVGTFSAT